MADGALCLSVISRTLCELIDRVQIFEESMSLIGALVGLGVILRWSKFGKDYDVEGQNWAWWYIKYEYGTIKLENFSSSRLRSTDFRNLSENESWKLAYNSLMASCERYAVKCKQSVTRMGDPSRFLSYNFKWNLVANKIMLMTTLYRAFHFTNPGSIYI